MTTASEAKGIYVTQELTESEPMIEEQSTSRLCHIHRKEYSLNVPQDDEFGDDHSKTVLDGKSKNIKTDGKKRIKCQETPNKLTSKTPLEPGASSAIKNNVPEDDEFLDEPEPPPFNFFDHDHNICVASELGLAYGYLILGQYAKYFDEKPMVPEQSSAEWDLVFNSDYHSFDPCNPWKTPPVETAGYLLSSSSSGDPQSPPSDEDLIGIDS
ncbi:hypothetical protein QL285_085245 [Trifolium repens]|nr:hypothetical protein QL285_085245 [Trifolium repens]